MKIFVRKRITFLSLWLMMASMSPLVQAQVKNDNNSIEEPIVGGVDTDITQIPWQVTIGGCGGSIISENWVVTAAHCDPFVGQTIKAGITSLSNDVGQVRTAIEVIVHPDWSDDTRLGADIALMRVGEPFDFSDLNVQPIVCATPISEINGLTATCRAAIVSGWGRLGLNADFPDILQSVTVPIVSNDLADAAYTGELSLTEGWITEDQLAAGDFGQQSCDIGDSDGGEDACSGDSGGPLVIMNNEGNQYLLAGVVSWGFGCAEAEYPGMYSRVSEFSDFITKYTGQYNNRYSGLLISEIVDGTNDGDTPKYLELYNSSSAEYNLTDVAIQVFSDGMTKPSVYDIPPGTVIEPGGTLVIADSPWDDGLGGGFVGMSPDFVSVVINGDGNDAYILYDKYNMNVIDAYGEINGENNECWNYAGSKVERRPWSIAANNGEFLANLADWYITPYNNDLPTPGAHQTSLTQYDGMISTEDGTKNTDVFVCDETYIWEPEIVIKNVGTEEIENVEVQVSFEGSETTETVTLSEGLANNEYEVVKLQTVDFGSEGDKLVSIEIVGIDGTTDQEPVNNKLEMSVNMVSGFNTEIVVDFDFFSNETAWTIEDSEGSTIYREWFGNYVDFRNESVKETRCLPSGCYTFNLLDNRFDGGAEAEMFLPEGLGLMDIQEENWTGRETRQFCILSPPTDLDAIASSSQEALISWTDDLDDEEGFELQQANTENGPWQTIANLPANTTQYIDGAYDEAGTLYYRLRVFKSDMETSPWVSFRPVKILSTTELGKDNVFMLYPNPTSSGYVNVVLGSINKDFTMTLLDAKGRLLQRDYIDRLQYPKGIHVDLENRHSGLYIIRLEAEGQSYSRKLMIE